MGLEQKIWWLKSDLILRSLGKRSRSKIKITYSDLDHTKDQDQLSDLDLLDQDHWSFNSSGRQTQILLVYVIGDVAHSIEVALKPNLSGLDGKNIALELVLNYLIIS